MLKKILLFIIFTTSPVWAEITVSFDPEEVHFGESTELILESPVAFKDTPDLSALTDALTGTFVIGGQKNEPYSRRINGRNIRYYRISYNVFPRKTGVLSSEGITLRNQLLPAATLTVLESSPQSQVPIQIQASVAQDKFFPNETFFYTLKLTDAAGLMSGQMTKPVAENATIQLMDNLDRVYQEYVEDTPIQITERTYAITPLSAGPLTIHPVAIYGKILTKKQSVGSLYERGILFDGSARDWREIRLETEPIHLTILPKPADWTGWWLPATQVSLEAEDTFPESIEVGQSLNRKIILKAMGTVGDYLPKLAQPQGDKFRVYASPEERMTIPTPVGDVQGIEILSVVLVPGQGGEMKIPAVRVPWFNTNTLKKEVAVIPEKIIQVQGGVPEPVAQSEQATPQVQAKQPQVSKAQPKNQKTISPKKKTPQPQIPQPTDSLNYGIITALGILLLLSLGGIIYLLKHKRPKSYLLPIKQEKKSKKEKKPLADLYPF